MMRHAASPSDSSDANGRIDSPAWFPDPYDPSIEILWDGQSWTGLKRPLDQAAERSDDSITLSATERRVPIGSMSVMDSGDGSISVSRTSEEARHASTPFDASQSPGLGSLVPADCVWAFDAPPTEFRGKPNRGDVRQRMQALGQLRGRTMGEIESYVGAPMAYDALSRTRVYGQQGLFGVWQITLRFDNYWVCVGISDEISV